MLTILDKDREAVGVPPWLPLLAARDNNRETTGAPPSES